MSDKKSLSKKYTKSLNLRRKAWEMRGLPKPKFMVDLKKNQALIDGFVYTIKEGSMGTYLELSDKQSQMLIDSVEKKKFDVNRWSRLAIEIADLIDADIPKTSPKLTEEERDDQLDALGYGLTKNAGIDLIHDDEPTEGPTTVGLSYEEGSGPDDKKNIDSETIAEVDEDESSEGEENKEE